MKDFSKELETFKAQAKHKPGLKVSDNMTMSEVVATCMCTDLIFERAKDVKESFAALRIEETKPLARALMKLYNDQMADEWKSLDSIHRKDMAENLEVFKEAISKPMFQLFIGIKNEIDKNFPDEPYSELRANAWMVVMMIDYLRGWMKRLCGVGHLSERIRAVDELMKGYAGCEVNDSSRLRIFDNCMHQFDEQMKNIEIEFIKY